MGEGKSPPQELEVGPRSRPYLLVLLKTTIFVVLICSISRPLSRSLIIPYTSENQPPRTGCCSSILSNCLISFSVILHRASVAYSRLLLTRELRDITAHSIVNIPNGLMRLFVCFVFPTFLLPLFQKSFYIYFICR